MDWPGKLTTLVFFQGCNLRCPWCQNVPLIDPRGGKEVDTKEVLRHVGAHKPIIDSMVFTGGEPLLQPSACLEISKEAKKIGLVCAIETNGTAPQALGPLLPYLDLVAIDVKAPLDDYHLYEEVTGFTGLPKLGQKVRKSLKLAIHSKVDVEARTTIVPGLNDDAETIARIAKGVRGVNCLRLQQFRNQRTLDPNFQKLPSPSREKLLKLARVAKQKGIKNVKIFTVEGGLENV